MLLYLYFVFSFSLLFLQKYIQSLAIINTIPSRNRSIIHLYFFYYYYFSPHCFSFWWNDLFYFILFFVSFLCVHCLSVSWFIIIFRMVIFPFFLRWTHIFSSCDLAQQTRTAAQCPLWKGWTNVLLSSMDGGHKNNNLLCVILPIKMGKVIFSVLCVVFLQWHVSSAFYNQPALALCLFKPS